MIHSIHLRNFRSVVEAEVGLDRINVIEGSSGSGKMAIVQALRLASSLSKGSTDYLPRYQEVRSLDADPETNTSISIGQESGCTAVIEWGAGGVPELSFDREWKYFPELTRAMTDDLKKIRVFDLWHSHLSEPSVVERSPKLGPHGGKLASVLDHLRDAQPEAFEEINDKLRRCVRGINRILFETDNQKRRQLNVRREDGKILSGSQLSESTLATVAVLAIARTEARNSIVCIHDLNRVLHPSLFEVLAEDFEFNIGQGSGQLLLTTRSEELSLAVAKHGGKRQIAVKDPYVTKFVESSDDLVQPSKEA